MRFGSLVAACAALIIASCDRPADAPAAPTAPAATAFSYASTGDMSGYYMPIGDIHFGKWRLDHMFMGQSMDFQAWAGGDRSATFAPVMLQFDDVTSPMVRTELGQAHSITARVLPTRYAVSDSRVEFEGTSPELGAVRFEGRLDQGALAISRRNLGDEGAVLSGTLTAGGQTVGDVRMRWWMGD